MATNFTLDDKVIMQAVSVGHHIKTGHFEKAAEFNNVCRSKGIQSSTIDFLICAVAYMENFIIFTTE